jgi:hypothetical protein
MKRDSNGFNRVTAGLVLVGTITTGVMWMETRYAKASEIGQVKVLILSNARENARSRLFDLEQTRRVRPLQPEEARRLQELQDEIADLTAKIGRLDTQSARP